MITMKKLLESLNSIKGNEEYIAKYLEIHDNINAIITIANTISTIEQEYAGMFHILDIADYSEKSIRASKVLKDLPISTFHAKSQLTGLQTDLAAFKQAKADIQALLELIDSTLAHTDTETKDILDPDNHIDPLSKFAPTLIAATERAIRRNGKLYGFSSSALKSSETAGKLLHRELLLTDLTGKQLEYAKYFLNL